MAKRDAVRPTRVKPAAVTRRPSEPLRPLPARRVGGSLIAAQARRTRYRGDAFPTRG
jgi:hypothetical protein